MGTKAESYKPRGFHSVTPHMVVKDAKAAIEFYKKVFGAEEVDVMPSPYGGIMHAEIRIGESVVMMADEMPMMEYLVSPQTLKGSTMALAMYVEDVDAVYKRALDAGATSVAEPMDAFWGDRYSKVRDPFGHDWEILCHLEELTPEEIGARAQEFFASFSGEGGE